MRWQICFCLVATLAQAQDLKPVGEALRNRDYRRAEELVRQVLKESPGNIKAMVDLGLALEGETRFDDAIQQYENIKQIKGKGSPTPDQLKQVNVEIRLLKAKQAQAKALLGLSGALISQETDEVELVFYAVRDPKREGLYRLKPLAAPDLTDQKVLTYRENPDGSCTAEIATPQEKTPEILNGSIEPDGSIKLAGPEHTLVLHHTPRPGWFASKVVRYTWQAKDVRLVNKIPTVLGSDTYRLPAYGFGGALAVDDGLVGLFIMTTPLPGATLMSYYYRDAKGCHPLRTAETEGDFLLPVRDGNIWPCNEDHHNYDPPPKGTVAKLVPGRTKPIEAIQAFWCSGGKPGFLTSVFSVDLDEVPPPAGTPDPAASLVGLSGPALREGTGALDLMLLPFKGRKVHLPKLPDNGRQISPNMGDFRDYNPGLLKIFQAGEQLGTQPLPFRQSMATPMGTIEGNLAAAPTPVPVVLGSVSAQPSGGFKDGDYAVNSPFVSGTLTIAGATASFASSGGRGERGSFHYEVGQRTGVCRWESGARFEFWVKKPSEIIGTWFAKDANNYRCSMQPM
jgi:hypothetical protein